MSLLPFEHEVTEFLIKKKMLIFEGHESDECKELLSIWTDEAFGTRVSLVSRW